MAAWVTLVAKLLGFIPWEQLVAVVLSKLLQKAYSAKTEEQLEKVIESAKKIHEAAAVVHSAIQPMAEHVRLVKDAVDDRVVTVDEAQAIVKSAVDCWAKGQATVQEFKDVFRKAG